MSGDYSTAASWVFGDSDDFVSDIGFLAEGQIISILHIASRSGTTLSKWEPPTSASDAEVLNTFNIDGYALNLDIDQNNYMIVCGQTNAKLYEDSVSDTYDSFIGLYAVNYMGFELIWGYQAGGIGYDEAVDVKFDNDDSVFATGMTSSALYGNYSDESANTDGWLIELNKIDGSLLRSVQFGGPEADTIRALDVGEDEGIVIVGESSPNSLFCDSSGGFAIKYFQNINNGFSLEYCTDLLSSCNMQSPYDVAIDSEGNSYIVGGLPVSYHLAICKIDISGNVVWSYQNDAYNTGAGCLIGITGHLVVTANTEDTVHLLEISMTDGKLLSTSSSADNNDISVGLSIATDAYGGLAVGGYASNPTMYGFIGMYGYYTVAPTSLPSPPPMATETPTCGSQPSIAPTSYAEEDTNSGEGKKGLSSAQVGLVVGCVLGFAVLLTLLVLCMRYNFLFATEKGKLEFKFYNSL